MLSGCTSPQAWHRPCFHSLHLVISTGDWNFRILLHIILQSLASKIRIISINFIDVSSKFQMFQLAASHACSRERNPQIARTFAPFPAATYCDTEDIWSSGLWCDLHWTGVCRTRFGTGEMWHIVALKTVTRDAMGENIISQGWEVRSSENLHDSTF